MVVYVVCLTNAQGCLYTYEFNYLNIEQIKDIIYASFIKPNNHTNDKCDCWLVGMQG
jgi:hypothetical protein